MFPADVQTIRENILVHTYWPISIAISGTEAELRCYARGIPWRALAWTPTAETRSATSQRG
eukprot:2016824-Rhodomonas_salina.3